MGTSAKMAPQSKPTRLNLPLVPEEVTFIPIRHLGMENRAWRLKNRVGTMGTEDRSPVSTRVFGEKPSPWAMARYSGHRPMCQAQLSATA